MRTGMIFVQACLMLACSLPAAAQSGGLTTGWEDGDPLGVSDQVLYKKDVVNAFNIIGSDPGCARRLGERPHSGGYSLQASGYSRAGYAYA
jgi:hypothetical protein